MGESVTITIENLSNDAKVLRFAWVAASNGSLTEVTTDQVITAEILGFSIMLGITDPGGTTPTDDYNVVIKDAYGVDMFGGELDDRDNNNSEQAVPKIDTVFGGRMIGTALTFDITDNSINAGNGDVYLYLER